MFTSSVEPVNPAEGALCTPGSAEKAAARFGEPVIVARLTGAAEMMWPVSKLAGAGLGLERAAAIRKFAAYPHKRAREGRWVFGPTGALVGCESSLEKQAVAWLEFEGAVGVASQPCRIVWPDGRTHVPDLFARTRDGSGVLVDVRPLERAGDAVFQRTADVCEQAGWGYVLFAGLPTAQLELLSALAAYRSPACAPPDRGALRGWLDGPPYGAAIGRFAAQHGVAVGLAKGWVAHLMWHRFAAVDFGMSFAEILS